MAHQEDTQRSPKQYSDNEKQQIEQQGADELARGRRGDDARANPEKQQENRRQIGVDEDHKTEKMKKEHRGTFP